MERNFVLSCCSTVDLPYAYMARRDIPVLFYHYVVGDQDYVDDMGRDPAALPRFYGFLKEGKLPQTSQINELFSVLRVSAERWSSGQFSSYIQALRNDDSVVCAYITHNCNDSGFNERNIKTRIAKFQQNGG